MFHWSVSQYIPFNLLSSEKPKILKNLSLMMQVFPSQKRSFLIKKNLTIRINIEEINRRESICNYHWRPIIKKTSTLSQISQIQREYFFYNNNHFLFHIFLMLIFIILIFYEFFSLRTVWWGKVFKLVVDHPVDNQDNQWHQMMNIHTSFFL